MNVHGEGEFYIRIFYCVYSSAEDGFRYRGNFSEWHVDRKSRQLKTSKWFDQKGSSSLTHILCIPLNDCLKRQKQTNETNSSTIVVNNKSHIYLVWGENLVQLSSVIHRGSLTNTLFHTMKAINNTRNDEFNLSKRENTLIKKSIVDVLGLDKTSWTQNLTKLWRCFKK